MPTVDDLKESKYIIKKDVEPPITVTIKEYRQVNVALESQEPEMRWALWFYEHPKPFVLNVTNGELIAAVLGSRDFDHWKDKRITLYHDPTIMFAGKPVGGIRVQAPREVPQTNANPAEEPPDDVPFR